MMSLHEFISIAIMAFLTVTANLYFLLFLFIVFVALSASKYRKLKEKTPAHFIKMHKFIAGSFAGVVFVAILYFAISPFVAIGLPSFGIIRPTGTIVFDRRQMNQVDRIEITMPCGEIHSLSDEQIADFVSATMVADSSTSSGGGRSKQFAELDIRLYNGNMLVREMALVRYCIRVYTSSATHRFFMSGLREPRRFSRTPVTAGYVSTLHLRWFPFSSPVVGFLGSDLDFYQSPLYDNQYNLQEQALSN